MSAFNKGFIFGSVLVTVATPVTFLFLKKLGQLAEETRQEEATVERGE